MENLLIDTVSRIVHVVTAIVLVGGTTFMRFVLMPAAAELPDAEHEALRARLVGRWKRVVHIGIALFLLSGLYNYLVVARPLHQGDGLYHALVGTKIMISLVIFFLASAVVGTSRPLESLRKNRKIWLAVIVVLAAVVIAISGFVKVRGVGKVEPQLQSEERVFSKTRLGHCDRQPSLAIQIAAFSNSSNWKVCKVASCCRG